MAAYLSMEDITKRFGDVYANRHVNLTVKKGEVHTLLGENGAGKSTLMNILMGLYHPTEGTIHLDGKKVRIESPAKAVKLGIGMVHQHFMLVEAMTVFENIILGTSKDRSPFVNREACRKEIQALSDRYGLEIKMDALITDISVGEQQRVEIVKALYRGAQLLILDEPTAALTDIEVVGLFEVIRKLTEEGKSLVFISHKMREVMEISHRITVLRAGETVATLEKDQTTVEELARLMIGRDLVTEVYEKKTGQTEPVLSLENICYHAESKHNGVKDINLTVNKGEILGIAGVDGNGQSQLAKLMTGVLVPDSGTMKLHKETISKGTPETFIGQAVSHIPEDRNKMGLVGNMSVKENLLLKRTNQAPVAAGSGWFLRRRAMEKIGNHLQQDYDIRCASIEQEARNLSGGNQQKIILARELEENPELLVAVHPTRGLDVGATNFIHEKMIAAREEGCGVVLISADFDEVLKLSDRIAVMYEGQVVGVYNGQNPPIDEISLAMSGNVKGEGV